MSNTPKFALRKPYSIREELAALNPFVRREQTGGRCGGDRAAGRRGTDGNGGFLRIRRLRGDGFCGGDRRQRRRREL